jgi:hypothetical protein
MPFPKDREAMEKQGYRREFYSRCRGCHAAMEWWYSPAGKRLPMDPMEHPDTPAISHFATCPEAQKFRKEPQRCTSPISTSQASQPSQSSLFSSPASASSSAAAAPSRAVDQTKHKDGN